MLKTTPILFFLVFTFLLTKISPAFCEQDSSFIYFINNFKNIAKKQGINEATFNLAFNGISSPYPNILTNVKHQPEFTLDAQTYINNRVTQARIDSGKQQKPQLNIYLDKIENKFGVDRNILLSIWANETNYGEALKNPKIMKDAIKALASLSYYKSRYNKYAQNQLIALLKILQKHYIDRKDLKSSWAGAMGQTQFIPTSYLQYAQDIDGDGKSDIINSIPDALATTANLLAKNGWQRNQPWILEISSQDAQRVKALVNLSYSLKHWRSLNIHQLDGSALPATAQKAKLMRLSGAAPRYILALHNFKVIKAYNNSDLYALSVGLLANALKN